MPNKTKKKMVKKVRKNMKGIEAKGSSKMIKDMPMMKGIAE